MFELCENMAPTKCHLQLQKVLQLKGQRSSSRGRGACHMTSEQKIAEGSNFMEMFF